MMNKIMIEHYENPLNKGKLEQYDAFGTTGNDSCGDSMDVYLILESNIIKDIKYYTFGCGSAVATASIMSEMVKGKDLKYAYNLTSKEVLDEISGFKGLPSKKNCNSLIERALKDAIQNYCKENKIEL